MRTAFPVAGLRELEFESEAAITAHQLTIYEQRFWRLKQESDD